MSAPRRRRGLHALLVAQLVSIFGTRMSFLAVPWFVLVATGSATRTGLVAFAEMLPYVLVQGFGGPAIDRLGAQRTAVVTDLVAGLAMGAVPVLFGAHLVTIPVLAGLVAVAGAARGGGDTAKHVLVPRVAEPAGMPLERAGGMSDGISRLAGLLGAPLAGVLVALTSSAVVIAIDAATFVVAALLVGTLVPRDLPTARPAVEDEPHESYLTSLRAGFSYLRHDRLLLGISAMVLVTNLLDQAYGSVLLPVWVRERLGSPVALGLVSMIFGIGAVTGNALLSWLGPKLPRRMQYATGFVVAGAPRFIALALAGSLSPVLAVAVLGGLGAGGINPALSAVEYERVPAHLQARVLGAVGATAWAGIPFGGLVGGLLAGTVGLRGALLGCGGVYLVATLCPFVFPVWRDMERGRTARTPAPAAAEPVPLQRRA